MRYKADHDYHIHSQLSSCSNNPKQTPEAILQYAVNNKFRKICLTDHFWGETIPGASSWYVPQNFKHISSSKPLPQDENTEFCFGAETDMDKNCVLGISKQRIDELRFLVIPTTHLHMKGFTVPDRLLTSEERARLWESRFEALLNMDLPWHKIGIAHLTDSLIADSETIKEVIGLLDTEKMYTLFKKSAQLGIGIELNFNSFALTDSNRDIMLKPYRIAKENGCKFYLGSDAHSPEALNEAKDNFENIIKLLDLSESDKFDFE